MEQETSRLCANLLHKGFSRVPGAVLADKEAKRSTPGESEERNPEWTIGV